MELCNLLKYTGLCPSGGIAKLLIADGKVLVNGETETRKRYKVRAGQVVEFNQQQIRVIE
ncbi:MAG: hypothetical protein B6I36_08540 [Desulfobacteraceae bacterium 4572_35.1]|nr:MAG: hypothetical protein B6I36_08540 [Desulfobacteraceae bacterium 4572_35.1]